MWEVNDKTGFDQCSKNKIGQISGGPFAQKIRDFAKNKNNKTFLEVGTWNGLGSTKQFVDELILRDDDYLFYSLECNSEKSEYARSLYKEHERINILNEVLYNEDVENFDDIMPQCNNNDVFKHWHEVDSENMKKCNVFLERKDIPETFDVVLLDGGEFTTYFEFQIIENKCIYLLLDDINTPKCKKIVEEIKSQESQWEIIEENDKERNGYMVCRNLNN